MSMSVSDSDNININISKIMDYVFNNQPNPYVLYDMLVNFYEGGLNPGDLNPGEIPGAM